MGFFFSTEEYHYNVDSVTEEKLKRIKSSNQYKVGNLVEAKKMS